MVSESISFAERRAALHADTPRRIEALQQLMRAKGLGAVILTGTAGPGLFGVPKYFTNLSLWYGKAFVVIGVDHPTPAIVHWSSFQSEWNRQEATTDWIETPDVAVAASSIAAFERAAAIAAELSGSSRKIGAEHYDLTWSAGEAAFFKDKYPEWEIVEIWHEIDQIRAVKSPFELSEIRLLGEDMTGAMERFAEVAKPGRTIWSAMAASEEYLKARGCSWGRAKMSLNQKPATILPTVDRVFNEDDLILYEIDYSGPFGHWYEMTCLFSFKPLSAQMQNTVDAYQDVIRLMVDNTRPGLHVGDLHRMADERFKELGFPVVGMHLPHVHSIGLDECDGPNSSSTADDHLEENMVLALHPGSIFADGTGYTMSDLFRVTPDGGERMSRKTWINVVIQ